MFTRDRVHTHVRAGRNHRNKAARPQRPRCVVATRTPKGRMDFSKEPRSAEADGVVNLALTFGTLLSSQGTDASFVLTLAGFPPGASLRYFVFLTLSDSFVSDFLGAFPVLPLGFRFPAVPTLSDPFGPDFRSPGSKSVCLPGCWAVPTPEL